MTRTAQIFSLAKPFWGRSTERYRAWFILGSLLFLVVASTALNAWNTQLNKDFFDALQNRDTAGFNHSLLLIFTTIFFIVAVAVTKRYLEQALEIRWRWSLTHDMVGRWFKDRAFYRIERDNRLDNPTSV